MGGFLGARIHYPNPVTPAQVRLSEAGGKYQDDRFRDMFLGGIVKRATITTAVTAATDAATPGSGVATVYDVGSENEGDPPSMAGETGVTVYNPSTTTGFAVGDTVNVVYTGRFYVITSNSRVGQSGIVNATGSRAQVTGTTNLNLTAANILTGFIEGNPTNNCNYFFPLATPLCAAMTSPKIGDTMRIVISNQSAFIIAVASGSDTIQGNSGSNVQIPSGTCKEFVLRITFVGGGLDGYSLYGLS